MKKKNISAIVLLLATLCSCEKSEEHSGGRYLNFDVSVEELLTRGSPITSLEDFSLYGYLYDQWSGNCTPNYIVGEKVSNVNGTWGLGHKCNVNEGDHKAKFYAVAPYEVEGLEVNDNQGGPLSFSYEVPSDVERQTDVLVSESDEYAGSETNLSLPFTHCLSSVTFKTGDKTIDGTVLRISLKGVYSQGTYEIGGGWSEQGGKANFDISPNTEIHKESMYEELSGGETTMMLMPQTVPDGGSIEVEVDKDGETETLSKSLSGEVWDEGTSYVYRLNFSSLIEKDHTAEFIENPYYSGDNCKMILPDSYDDWNYRISWQGINTELSDVSDLSDCIVVMDINSKSSNKGEYSLMESGDLLFNAASFQGGKLTHHGLRVSGKLVLPDDAEDCGMIADVPINFRLSSEDGMKEMDNWQYTLKGYMYGDINFSGNLDGCNTSNPLLVTSGNVTVTYTNSDGDSFERSYTGEEFRDSFLIQCEDLNGAKSTVNDYYTGYEISFSATRWSSETRISLISKTNSKELYLGSVYPYQGY